MAAAEVKATTRRVGTGAKRRIAVTLIGVFLALALAALAVVWVTLYQAFSWLGEPPGPCSVDHSRLTLESASHEFPQLADAYVERSICPASWPGGGQITALVLAPGSVAEGIRFSPYDDIIEWGPEGAVDLLPDLFPAGDLSSQMVASHYGQGNSYALHLLRSADKAGPVVLIELWL